MLNLKFWDNWIPTYKIPFQVSLGLLGVFIVLLVVAMWRSPAPTVTWQYTQERETQEMVTHQFQSGPFALQTKADNTVLFERLVGSDFAFQEWPMYAYFGAMLFGFALLLTVMSCLSRFWFLLGSGFVIFFISNLQLELLAVLGDSSQYAAISLMAIVICTGLAFQYFFESVGFGGRLITYLIVVGATFAALALLARIPNPVYFMAANFIPATVIVTAFLAMFTAHELIALLVKFISRSSKGSNGLGHFIILSTIYLANLGAIYLSRLGWFTWDFSISPVLLMAISATIAIWGVRRQEAQMEGFMLPGPLAPLAILAVALIAVGGSAFFYTTGNDAALETITNMSLYAHIGFGLVFVLYIISNFGAFLKDNHPVIQVLYKPKVMPFFTFRFAGSIAMLAFILYISWLRPIRDTQGARDAAIGDYHILTGDIQLAEGYYEKSNKRAFHNHHANFVLGNIEMLKNDRIKARLHYLNAAENRPTLQAYMNAVSTLDQSPIQLYGYLKEIERDFPKSGVVSNEFGLIYRKLKQPDSALYFFSKASMDGLTESTGLLNALATATLNNLPLRADSVLMLLDDDDYPTLTNVYSLANAQQTMLKKVLKPVADTLLNVFTANYLANTILNHADSLDTAFLSHAVKVAYKPANSAYREEVLAAAAHGAYKNGIINKAFEWQQKASFGSDHQGRYNNNMALWALDQSAPSVALTYLQFAINQGYADALLTQAIAYSEEGKRAEAIILFDSLRSKKDLTAVTESMIRVLAADKTLLNTFNDLEKYAYCRYRLGYADSLEFIRVIAEITDPNWRARAILDRSKKMFAWDEVRASIELYNSFSGLAMSDANLFDEIHQHEMLLQAAIGNVGFLKSKFDAGWRTSALHQSERLYYEALIAQATVDTASAKQKLLWIAANNAFFDLGILAAADAVKNSTDKLHGYTILAGALQINPHNVRLLKAYIQEARRLEFDDFAQDALQTLSQVLPQPLYQKFVSSLR